MISTTQSLFGRLDRPASAVLFAGMGGACEGIRLATGTSPLVAVNHCAHALRVHARNHPDVLHLQEDVFDVVPSAAVRGRKLDLLWLSPDCTHFSRAKGKAPKSSGRRSLANVAIDWARSVRPAIIILENVAEFLTWGPLDDDGQPVKERAGEDFKAWCEALRDAGYCLDWRVLSAADYGAPTSRRRLFIIARCDGRPIVWPEPAHGPGRMKPWRTAAECIDWAIPCPSIFGRSKPLAEATERRIAEGLRRFVLESQTPFIIHHRGQSVGRSINEPMPTVTATGQGHLGIVTAWVAKHYGNGVVVHGLSQPIGAITTVDHHSICTATLGESYEVGARRVSAFLVKYYGEGGQWQRCDEPLHTIPTVDRFGLVQVTIDGQPYVVTDIGMRMLQPRELARAMGFDDSYILEGTKAEQVARIGNAVCPPIAKAIVEANIR